MVAGEGAFPDLKPFDAGEAQQIGHLQAAALPTVKGGEDSSRQSVASGISLCSVVGRWEDSFQRGVRR
jgi:hypothetical protein